MVGKKKSCLPWGIKTPQYYRDRGSNFQSQLEFYLRFDLCISPMLKTIPVTAPSLQIQYIIGPNLLSKQDMDLLCSACLGPVSPWNTSPLQGQSFPSCHSPHTNALSASPDLSSLSPLHRTRKFAFPSLQCTSISLCICYFYITFCSCLI